MDRVAVQPIVAGEILMRERFAASEDGSTLAALVGEKMRAVTVRVDDVIGVGGFLLPGNRVDVLAARREANQRATAETILRDVKVLAVDQTAATEKNEPVIVRAVTLEVNPEQAEILVKAKEEGSIQLTLRNPLDDEVFVEAKPPPAPAPVVRAAPAPAPPRPRGRHRDPRNRRQHRERAVLNSRILLRIRHEHRSIQTARAPRSSAASPGRARHSWSGVSGASVAGPRARRPALQVARADVDAPASTASRSATPTSRTS